MFKKFINKHPISVFYFISLLIATGVIVVSIVRTLMDPAFASVIPSYISYVYAKDTYGNALQIIVFAATEQPWAGLILLFAGAPTIAAILVTASRGGFAAVRQLFLRLRPWGGQVTWQRGLRVYGVFLVIYLAVSGIYFWLTYTLSGPYAFDIVSTTMGGSVFVVILTLLAGLFIDEGGTLEELGWRGFALPLLLERLKSPMRATLLLGLLWWAWHLPREITTLLGPVDLGMFVWNQLTFLVLCCALSILMTYMFYLTGGSVLSAIFIHGGTNVWSKGLSAPLYGALSLDLRTVFVVTSAIVVVVLTRGRLGASQRVPSDA